MQISLCVYLLVEGGWMEDKGLVWVLREAALLLVL